MGAELVLEGVDVVDVGSDIAEYFPFSSSLAECAGGKLSFFLALP